MQSHTPTVVQGGGGGGGLMERLPRVFFYILQYYENILPSVESLWFQVLNKMRYILWAVALRVAYVVTKHGRHLGFYQQLEMS